MSPNEISKLLNISWICQCHPLWGGEIFQTPDFGFEKSWAKLDEQPFFAGKLAEWSLQSVESAEKLASDIHRENGGTLGMVPLIINPIYTLYSGYLLGISRYIPFERAPWGVKQLGYHLKGTTIFPMRYGATLKHQASGGLFRRVVRPSHKLLSNNKTWHLSRMNLLKETATN